MTEAKRQRNGGRRQTAKAQPRRSDIVSAAEQLFYEKGFDATTTQDIADRVGMLKGSLYYHIDSKEQVLLEIIERLYPVFSSNIAVVREVEASALEKIWVFVYRLALANAVDPVGSGVFLNEFRALRAKARARIIELRDEHDRLLRELVVDGQVHGVVCERFDAKLTATAVLTMCNAIPQWYERGRGMTPEFIARSYASLVHSEISCDPEIHRFHDGIDGTTLVPRLHALSFRP